MDLASLIAPWATQTHELVPGVAFFDAHTHIGQNDPDGMSQTPEQLIDGLRRAGAVGAFAFAMHEPDGYPPANDMVLQATRASDGLLIPFVRVSPNAGDAPQEALRMLDAGVRGIKLHPRAEQFTLDHPAVRELAAIAAEREVPILVHAGRGIPALGRHMVALAGEFPRARFILAHAGITDLAWLWKVAPDHPNLLFDTAWWIGPDVRALFSLVPPGQIVFASDAPYGSTLIAAITQLRIALQAGLSDDQIRSVTSEQALRVARGEPLAFVGPAVGEREEPTRSLLARVTTFTLIGALMTLRGDAEGRGAEMIALARLACEVPEGIDDGPVFAAIAGLLAAHDELIAADPDDRRIRSLLMLAAAVGQTPDVPLPPDLPT